MGVGIRIDKAKDIAHGMRRVARAQEFAPLDIKATIPAEAAAAEAQRQLVREKYAQIQIEIDAAQSVDVLKTIVTSL
jgi:hypothetical protein